MKNYYISELKVSLITILQMNGVEEQQAKVVVESMINADMRGVHSHGVSLFPSYIEKIRKHSFNFIDSSVILKETNTFAIVDANGQIGMVSAKYCMELAIDRAKQKGVFTVFCRNANTFGAAFNYVKMATDNKMIGICFSNSPSAMPAWGGNKKILGTNPFAIGIPARQEDSILIDMATSVVAKSKINEALKQGKEIPIGWAVDENGIPTTNPAEAIKGMVLPMAEHKGYAIAMAIDILSGVLSGAAYLNHVNRFYSDNNVCMNVGQTFIVINPTLILGDSFYDRVDNYIEELKASGNNVFYPGEKGNKKMKECENVGIELTDDVVDRLTTVFDEYGLRGALLEYGTK